jgi:hypothetical protein
VNQLFTPKNKGYKMWDVLILHRYGAVMADVVSSNLDQGEVYNIMW